MKNIIFLINIMVIGFYPIKADDLKEKILSMKKRSEVRDRLLSDRFETVLPKIMNRTKIDMWIIIAREYNEDPVIRTMLPANWLNARRRTILVIYNPGNGKKLETYAVARYDVGKIFKKMWDPEKEPNQYKALAELIEKKNPKKIGLNQSKHFAQADGLTATEYDLFKQSLTSKNRRKITSAEKLAIGWLETRSALAVSYTHLRAHET